MNFDLTSSLDTMTQDAIKSACKCNAIIFTDATDTKGLQAVYVFFLPVVLLCLFMCLFIKVSFLSPKEG